jgi:hypothetical protein
MKSVSTLLRSTAKILASDVSLFRKIILDSGGGQLPDPIREKQKLLQEIEKVLRDKVRKNSPDSHSSVK